MLTNEQRDQLLAGRSGEFVTEEAIKKKISQVTFLRPSKNGTFTVCLIEMQNGFELIGTSACADPDNFNEELGKKIAYDSAIRQIATLEGYVLREILYLRAADKKAA